MSFKNFFSRFMPEQPEQSAPSAPKAEQTPEEKEALERFIRRAQEMQEMQEAQPVQGRKNSIPLYGDYPRERDHVPAVVRLATLRDDPVIEVLVAYAIFHGNRCVFTAARRNRISTEVCGEGIIEMIARREHRQVASMRYYELRTLTGYSRWKGGSGRVEFDQLLLSSDSVFPNRIYIRRRCHAACPDYVLELFKEYAAGSGPQIIHEGAYRDF